MKTLAAAFAFAALLSLTPLLNGDDQKPPKAERQKLDPDKVKKLMHKKLEHAQRLMAALVLNNVDQVGQHAADLGQLSKEAEWMIFKTPQYVMNSDDFRRSAEKLVRQSKEKDLEGAKLTYLELTMTCFHCHRYVRDVGMVRLELDGADRHFAALANGRND